jgi:hypothetical protein
MNEKYRQAKEVAESLLFKIDYWDSVTQYAILSIVKDEITEYQEKLIEKLKKEYVND